MRRNKLRDDRDAGVSAALKAVAVALVVGALALVGGQSFYAADSEGRPGTVTSITPPSTSAAPAN